MDLPFKHYEKMAHDCFPNEPRPVRKLIYPFTKKDFLAQNHETKTYITEYNKANK